MSGSVLDALGDVWECSGRPPKCPGVVGRPSRICGSSLKAPGHLRKWSEDPPGCQGMVR